MGIRTIVAWMGVLLIAWIGAVALDWESRSLSARRIADAWDTIVGWIDALYAAVVRWLLGAEEGDRE